MKSTVYNIYKDNILIGTSKLERGDAPMGIALGNFHATSDFDTYRKQFEILDEDSRRLEGLILKKEDGTEIECSIGKVVIEYGDINNPFHIEFTALGISYPLYEELFPHHVKAYQKQFEN